MPPIPGLAPMLTMIFCPTMQLRANSKSSRFTGCLSGLGKDHATQMAVYPDHDMEVVFDTLFDTSDIELVRNEAVQAVCLITLCLTLSVSDQWDPNDNESGT